VTVPTVSTLDLYTSNGWPSERGQVYFGGDDGSVYKDFQITVSTSPVVYGDLNNNGTITAADWMILRANQYAEVGGSYQDAYFRGDLTADLANDHDDFVAFKTLYEAANGAGSFARMLASIPEPSSLALFLSAMLLGGVRRRPMPIRV
jgi:hypothetical protein